MSEWKEFKLKDLTTKIGSGATPSGGSNNYKLAGISLIRSQNVLDFQFSLDGLAFIDDEQADALRNVIVYGDDILLNITGDSVARVCKVPKSLLPARVNQHVAIIRVNDKKLNSNFLLYYLQSIKGYLLSISEIGGTRNALTKSMVENLELKIPSLFNQEKIADILSSLDNKIDLLLRQNETLEALAETLFKQWFIVEADESWVDKRIGDVITIKSGTTPSTIQTAFWNGDIYWTSPRDLSKNDFIYLFDTERKITKEGLAQIGSGLLPIGTVLLSSRAPIGYLAITEIPVAINQGYIAIICDKDISNYYMFLWLKNNMETIINSGNGSTFMEISKSVFRELDFVMPPAEKLEAFDKLITPIFEKIKSNAKQIQTLIKLRDILLPKLMSGEVRVENLAVSEID